LCLARALPATHAPCRGELPVAPPLSSSSAAPAVSPAPSETLQRPEPGLARGAVEAKPWAILALAFALVAAAAVYGARRAGLWARLRKNARR
jgi:hypothetical protein